MWICDCVVLGFAPDVHPASTEGDGLRASPVSAHAAAGACVRTPESAARPCLLPLLFTFLGVMLKVSPPISLFLLHTQRHVHTQTGHTCAEGRLLSGSPRRLSFKWWEVVGGWERSGSPSWPTMGDPSLEGITSSRSFRTPTLKTHSNSLNRPNPSSFGDVAPHRVPPP